MGKKRYASGVRKEGINAKARRYEPVSYTHLTLPTNREVEIPAVLTPIYKKKKI